MKNNKADKDQIEIEPLVGDQRNCRIK